MEAKFSILNAFYCEESGELNSNPHTHLGIELRTSTTKRKFLETLAPEIRLLFHGIVNDQPSYLNVDEETEWSNLPKEM